MLRTDVMLDLETLGTGPDAAIVQIGAVAFCARGDDGTVPIDELLADAPTLQLHVSLASAVDSGGTMDAATVLWWLRQSDAARAAFSAQPALSLNEALDHLSDWWRACADAKARLWGNGADFDPVILGRSYDRLGIARPWGRWNVRCFRTLRAEHSGIAFERRGTAHRALDDALSQARHLLAVRRAVRAAA